MHHLFEIESPKHPLVSVLRVFNKLPGMDLSNYRFSSDLYTISLKAGIKGSCVYGRNSYDYEDGTMTYTAPGQTMQVVDSQMTITSQESWMLLFHPDLIRKSNLGRTIQEYSFFHYESNEALHLSDKEKRALTGLVEKIEEEINQNIDKHSQEIIIHTIESILKYSLRFYDRQFYTRTNYNKDIVCRFEEKLKQYYDSDLPTEIGVPTVSYLGKELDLSPYYLSDLLKKETGRNTMEHIHFFIIDRAKTILLNSNKSVSEIAYELGFEYPQHFAKVFKNKTNMSPSEYRKIAQ